MSPSLHPDDGQRCRRDLLLVTFAGTHDEMRSSGTSEWAQGSLRLLSAAELLELLARRRFTGRLTLVSPSPRQVVAVLLDDGRPAQVLGSGVRREAPAAQASHHARQVLLEALAWTVGTFRIETAPATNSRPTHHLGEVEELLAAARRRDRVWARLMARLPRPLDEVVVAPAGPEPSGRDPTHVRVRAAVRKTMPLADVPVACGLDDYVALAAALDLADAGLLTLGSAAEVEAPPRPALTATVRGLLDVFQPDGAARTLKLTVLSWDARTCFRAVEAILGRDRSAPDDADELPCYHILHETAALGGGLRLEILAFRADAFEPLFAAPLVQDCHLFLLFTDIEAGHVLGTERPLVERVNELRAMFRGTSVAARVTVGLGAVTDPGCDVLIPELGRFEDWRQVVRPTFLPWVLTEVAARLGIEETSTDSGAHTTQPVTSA